MSINPSYWNVKSSLDKHAIFILLGRERTPWWLPEFHNWCYTLTCAHLSEEPTLVILPTFLGVIEDSEVFCWHMNNTKHRTTESLVSLNNHRLMLVHISQQLNFWPCICPIFPSYFNSSINMRQQYPHDNLFIIK